jgi:hypothetical protein
MVKNAFVEYKINAKCDLRKKEHENHIMIAKYDSHQNNFKGNKKNLKIKTLFFLNLIEIVV